MIIILSGTMEGREISNLLATKGYEFLSVTAAANNARVIVRNSRMEITEESPMQGALETIFQNQPVRVVIDTTYPFTESISFMAKELCQMNNIRYIRFVREEVDLPENPLLFPVFSWEDAAEQAAKLGNTVFLTTGSYNLELFIKHPAINGKRVVVRVLPDYRVIERVQALGISPKDIVAMQGPFSKDINKATFKMYNASVIVTKDSGRAGGTDNKISAALNLKIPVVVIKRPKLSEDVNVIYNYDGILKEVAAL